MSSSDTGPVVRPLWMQPWCWMVVALTATGAAFVWARLTGEDHVPLDIAQVGIVFLGLLTAGVAVWMRCASRHAGSLNDLPPLPRQRALYAVAAAHAGLALAVSAWLVAKFGAGRDLPGDVGGVLILWILTAPWCAYSAYLLVQRTTETPLEERFETAILVTQAGLVCMLASWALCWGTDYRREAWDSARLFLAVLAAAVLLAAPLVAASSAIRKLGVSLLIALHFAAILTAVLGAAPGPWLFAPLQVYVFRPYLDFMYLNNAYRFYAPEPTAASQVWFCVEYKRGDRIVSHWVKLPDMDSQGHHKYATSVQYTRRLALTENVARADPMPPLLAVLPDGSTQVAPFALRRDMHLPQPMYKDTLGKKQAPSDALIVPMHPDPTVVNYQQPTIAGRQLLASYARFILRQPPPAEFKDATPHAVKIYRVQHRILGAEQFALGADPHDMIFFLPYYVGKYDADGNLKDPQDPFLYWLLPILHENPNNPRSPVVNHAFRHAEPDQPQRKLPPLQ